VFYGHDHLPAPGELAYGGIIKFQRLSTVFPNTPRHFNIIYMVSSNYPSYAMHLVRAAQRKGARFVWNQDGVAYPAWMPSGWEKLNASLAEYLQAANYVFYQSEFSRISSDEFLGKRSGLAEILYNAVDTGFFRPAFPKRSALELVLLAAGSKYVFERIESPIRTLACVCKSHPRARLIFAGKVWNHLLEPTRRLIAELGLEEHVTFLPPFTQTEAPGVFQQADILIHTKINDPCPGVVIEAMACGLPVVYSDSGGVPELVGEEAGVGVPTEASWERFVSPAPEIWAEAVLTVAEARSRYAEAARQRTVERFDLVPWVERHRQVFSELLEKE
jgi:glycosyltransferase involved in cell wall biosynthesis